MTAKLQSMAAVNFLEVVQNNIERRIKLSCRTC